MLEEFTFRHSLRVRYPETDAQAIVYHANYLIYCDVARIEWLRLLGERGPKAWEHAQLDVVLVHAALDFRASARFDDVLTIGIKLAAVGNSSFTLAYGIVRDETLVCTAKTVHVTIDRASRTKVTLPPAFVAQLRSR